MSNWQWLAHSAVAPNPFYAPWALLPALQHLGAGRQVSFLEVVSPRGVLLGLFPLEVRNDCLRLPIRTLSFWKHELCHLTTPLVHADHVWEVLDVFWRWFERDGLGCRVLDTSSLAADGAFHAVWSDFLLGRCWFPLRERAYGLCEPCPGARSGLAETPATEPIDKPDGCRHGLPELSRLEYREVADPAEVAAWTARWLELEAASWKGRARGGAGRQREAACFLEMTRAGVEAGGVALAGYYLNGRPLALVQILMNGESDFCFQVLCDERHTSVSPDVGRELQRLRSWYTGWADPALDSRAGARPALFRLASKRCRMISRSLISNRSRRGDFLISALPLLGWMRGQWPSAPGLPVSARTPEGCP